MLGYCCHIDYKGLPAYGKVHSHHKKYQQVKKCSAEETFTLFTSLHLD